MFTVEAAAAKAIRLACEKSGDLAAVAEFQRHFQLIQGNELARSCARAIAGWTPVPRKGDPAKRLKAGFCSTINQVSRRNRCPLPRVCQDRPIAPVS